MIIFNYIKLVLKFRNHKKFKNLYKLMNFNETKTKFYKKVMINEETIY